MPLALKRALFSIFILLTTSQWCLGVYFAAKAPTAPDRQLDAVYPIRIHQSVVYVTHTESYFYNQWIIYVAVLCGAPVMIYEVLAQRKRFRKRRDEESP
jgi:hypothetical protein